MYIILLPFFLLLLFSFISRPPLANILFYSFELKMALCESINVVERIFTRGLQNWFRIGDWEEFLGSTLILVKTKVLQPRRYLLGGA